MTSNGDGGGFWKFWTTLPGLITAIATLITALVTAGIIVQRNGPGPPSSPPSSAAPRAIPPSPPLVPTSPEGTRGTGPTAPKVLWYGEVRFPNNTGLDLADGEPRIRPKVEAREFVINAGSFAGNPVPVFYHWRGQAGKVEKRTATLSDCLDALIAQQGPIYGRVNDSFCFESQDRTRLAAVSVRGWDSNYWATDVQVWQLTGQ